MIDTKTLISKLKQIQEKTLESSSLEEEDSIECPLKDVQFTIKNQKGSKQPLRRSPRKRINIDHSSTEPDPSKKSPTQKLSQVPSIGMEDRDSKKWQINVSKGFRSGLLFRRHFVLESMKLLQKTFDKTKNLNQNFSFL